MKNNFFLSLYLQSLQDNSEHFQSAIEGLLEKYQVQPVGNGFIDLIIEKLNSKGASIRKSDVMECSLSDGSVATFIPLDSVTKNLFF